MARNGDIRGFFGAKPSSSNGSRSGTGAAMTTSSLSSLPSSPTASNQGQKLLSSSPSTPVAAPSASARRPLGPLDEIKGSDEEDSDGDSDDSLESLSAIIGRGTGGGATYQRPEANATTTTPRAKRVASSSAVYGSPLTLQQKQQQQQQQRHKFDLKALISHTRQSEKVEESSRRAEELIMRAEDSVTSSDEEGRSSGDDDAGGSPSGKQGRKKDLKKVAQELLSNGRNNGNSGGGGGGGGDASTTDDENPARKGDKIVRAIDRTQTEGARRWCYFFDLDLPPLFRPVNKAPFPAAAAAGPWRFLANPDPRSRNQAVISGLPHTLVARGRELPPELFSWILDQVCVERDPRLRAQYCALAAGCGGCIRRLIDAERLYGALARIGGPQYDPPGSGSESGTATPRPRAVPEVSDPYRGRDWSGLSAFLLMLARMAPNMDPDNAAGAVPLLLRMSLDPVLVAAVRREHATALEALVAALPGALAQWNIVCGALCSYVLGSVDGTTQRTMAVRGIPKSTARLADLRRRLAAASLFDDAALGAEPPDRALSAARLLARLDACPDLQIRPDTDYEDLAATVALLDATIDGAGFLREGDDNTTTTTTTNSNGGKNDSIARSSPPCLPSSPTPINSDAKASNQTQDEDRSQDSRGLVKTTTTAAAAAADKAFDARVDTLTFWLRTLHDRIHDNGAVGRKDAKTTIDGVAKRLAYAVRTRPPPRASIFDHAYDLRREQEQQRLDLPRQRDFMRNWTSTAAATADVVPSASAEGSSKDGDGGGGGGV